MSILMKCLTKTSFPWRLKDMQPGANESVMCSALQPLDGIKYYIKIIQVGKKGGIYILAFTGEKKNKGEKKN